MKYLRTRVDATKYQGLRRRLGRLGPRRGRLYHGAAEVAGPGPRRDPPDRPLLRPAAARFRHSRHRPADPCASATMPTATLDDDDQSADQRRAGRPRLLHGPAGARIPGQLGDAEPGPAPVGVHRRRLAVEHQAAEPDRRRQRLHRRRPDDRTARQIQRCHAGDPAMRSDDSTTSRRASRKCSSAIRPSLACRSASASTGFRRSGRCGIDIAKALLKQKGDDTKLFSFNVGTSILMKISSISGRARGFADRSRRRVGASDPGADRSPSSTSKRSAASATPARPRRRRCAGQVNALEGARTALATPLQTEASRSRRRSTRCKGKEPDAALQARVKAFQTKQQQAAQETPAPADSRSSATRPISRSRSAPSSARSTSR